MARLLYILALGLLGAGIVHIAVLLLIPVYSERDAWTRIAALGPSNSVIRVGGAGSQGVQRSADPLFETAVCQFDLGEGPVHATASGKVPFWSISVFNRQGQNVFSLSDRTATNGVFDIIIVTPTQLVELRKDLPPQLQASIVVETDLAEGMLVVRGLVPDPTWRAVMDSWLGTARCGNA